MTKHYFATDGNYGDAEGLVVLDTTDWGPDHWAYIESLSEGERAEIAEDVSLGRGSLDYQDCTGITDNDETDCEFHGVVYRHFEFPECGEDAGYTWTCPECGTENTFEGVEDES